MRMNGALRSFIIIALLLLGVMVVYLPEVAPAFRGQAAVARADQHTYVADLDFWQRTERETTIVANARFDLAADLNDIPLTIGDWQGVEVPETNQEVMILLDPEQYVQRLYQNSQGQYVWLSLIGGRSSQPFHAPDICYDADGWQYNLGSHPISLNDSGAVYGLWLEAQKIMPGDDHITEHIVYYFYLFPDERRNLADGIVLFKLTSARYGSVEETLNIQADLLRNLFTSAY
jgi:hypothetical protein